MSVLVREDVVLDSYEEVRAALNSADLVRSLDFEAFEHGNIMEKVLLMLTGTEHRDRRRIENALFRRDRLALFEERLFPEIISSTLEPLVDQGDADLLDVGALLAVVLSGEAAGIDFDRGSIEERRRLVEFLRIFARGEAIDAELGNIEDIKAQVREALKSFDREYYAASRERREALIANVAVGKAEEADLPADVLTVLLRARSTLPIDDATIMRETAFFFEAGAHTSTQTFTNTLHFLFEWCSEDDRHRTALEGDLALVQRSVHEALRLRPTNPRILRRAVVDTVVGSREVRKGSLVALDTATANRDRNAYGPTADKFDPDRDIPSSAARYGHGFGGGVHACIGRNLAVGLPVRGNAQLPPDHLFGLVSLMVQRLLRAGVQRDTTREPVPDAGTRRWTRWISYPVQFEPQRT